MKAMQFHSYLSCVIGYDHHLVNEQVFLTHLAGIWMREVAPNQLDQEDLFKGYGNSLILQGSFLLGLRTL